MLLMALPIQNDGIPVSAHSGQNQPENFDEIVKASVQLPKFLKEKCCSKRYQQLSFKYFAK